MSCLLFCGVAAALDGVSETQPVANCLALARARTALLEQVRALPLGEGLTVGQWTGRSIALDRSLRRWIRQRGPCVPARVRADGVCEVELRLAPAALRDHLRQEPAPEAGPVEDAVGGTWPVLRAIGTALAVESLPADCPPGWEDVTCKGRALAERAALAEARHALLEQAGQLRVTPAYRLREFLDSGPAVWAAMHEAISQRGVATVHHEVDQVCEAELRFDVPTLARIAAQVHADVYDGDAFTADDFRDMMLSAGAGQLSARGLAPPPGRCILRNPVPPRAESTTTQPSADVPLPAATQPVEEN